MVVENRRICVIDMGSAHVSTVIAEIGSDEQIQVLGFGTSQNRGIQRGSIVDMDKLVASLKQAISYAEDMADCRVYEAWLCVSHASVNSFNCSGRVSVDNVQITTTDIVRTLATAKRDNLLDDYYLVNHFQHGISINGGEELTLSPISMLADEIEAYYHLMMLPVTVMQNLEQAMGLANVHIQKILVANIASSSFALLPEETEQGVCCVDIGAGTTNISVYGEDKLILTKTLSVGGYDVTRDIASELRISMGEAEKLKLIHGRVNLEDIDFAQVIEIPGLNGTIATAVSVREVVEIMSARYEEILKEVVNVIEQAGLLHVLQRGFVYCGGGSQVVNFARFANRITRHSAQIANFPQSIQVEDMYKKRLQGYQYQTVCGALIYSESEQFTINEQSEPQQNNDGFFDKLIKNPYNSFINFLSRVF